MKLEEDVQVFLKVYLICAVFVVVFIITNLHEKLLVIHKYTHIPHSDCHGFSSEQPWKVSHAWETMLAGIQHYQIWLSIFTRFKLLISVLLSTNNTICHKYAIHYSIVSDLSPTVFLRLFVLHFYVLCFRFDFLLFQYGILMWIRKRGL